MIAEIKEIIKQNEIIIKNNLDTRQKRDDAGIKNYTRNCVFCKYDPCSTICQFYKCDTLFSYPKNKDDIEQIKRRQSFWMILLRKCLTDPLTNELMLKVDQQIKDFYYENI